MKNFDVIVDCGVSCNPVARFGNTRRKYEFLAKNSSFGGAAFVYEAAYLGATAGQNAALVRAQHPFLIWLNPA